MQRRKDEWEEVNGRTEAAHFAHQILSDHWGEIVVAGLMIIATAVVWSITPAHDPANLRPGR